MMTNSTIEQPIKHLKVSAKHAEMRMVRANETYLFGSRGSFKTSFGIALFIIDNIYDMPGSTGVGVGLSFKHLNENTLPPLKLALMKLGFEEGKHFVLGKRPPDTWPKPYVPVVDDSYEHVMSWHNGSVIQFVSLMRKASANGISAQWGFFDEVKFMDQTELEEEINAIFRGDEEIQRQFAHLPGYLSKFFCTDKLADPIQIQWLLDKRKLNNPRKVKTIISLQAYLYTLKRQYSEAGINGQQKLRKSLYEVESRLRKLRSSLTYVVEIDIEAVRPLLGEKYYQDKKRNSTELIWKVAYKNEDPDQPGEPFYPEYKKEVIEYASSEDIYSNLPLIVAFDYQHSIAPMPIAQISTLPGAEEESFNYIDEVYTVSDPKEPALPNGNGSKGGLKAALKIFCQRYKQHSNRLIYYCYDHTATGKRVDEKDYAKIVVEYLEKNDWTVVEVHTGDQPDHYQKYVDTQSWMKGEGADYSICINAARCHKLRTSIKNSKTRISSGVTKKDKRLEDTARFPKVNQADTTHFSDTFDMINDAVLKQRLIQPVADVSPIAFR